MPAVLVCAVNEGVSAPSASVVANEPVAVSVPSSATAPELVPVMTGASSDPVTVTVTVSLTDSPSAVVDVTVNVSSNRCAVGQYLSGRVVEAVSPRACGVY